MKEDIIVYLPLSHKYGFYRRYMKRPIDFILSLIAIIVFSPFLLIIGLLVRIKLGSPVIFKQRRPGLNQEIFILYKFRSMTDKRNEKGELFPDHVRLIKFGKFLRSTSLDELPELFNVLVGDMSVIGPRPLLTQYLPLYNQTQLHRHDVRPGLSGLAQVSGRNAISWEDKLKLDLEYVDNVSFIGDWKIIFLTLKKVFVREGINSDTAATMEPFQGTANNKLLIIGASGHGKVIADIAVKMNRWQTIVFLDDDENMKESLGIKVVGKSSDAYKYIKEYDFCIGIGNNASRENILKKLEAIGASIPVLVHPEAVIGEHVVLGSGTVVMANAVINCSTKIGKGCIINTAATIDHDNLMDDYVHISPGVHTAGTVKIGKGTWLGIGSIVSNNVTITSGCKIGAGTVVVRDIYRAGTYVGVPARRV